ncbi:glycosyltransferase family 2 protein [Ruegeria sp. 2205SS24-7]|uniref:glycosyltransferase family 2 protein n=1 Tax=Ruegeria discodermiae TaxID=3064389 RepID=UPI0027406A9D|nr:glycosyltransferase family 2 protein [Ruegeria sp. 2205SS24-7]MDP5220693.1 glycosyltransferase family 2 protein [Ruegeria sp. 2205SS24-7]
MAVRYSIIVPILNEEDSVGLLYSKVANTMDGAGLPFELIFVDDGSTDTSFQKLSELAAADPRVVVLKFRKNYGQTAAMTAGIEYARGSVLVTMDGDLQNDPSDIPMMLAKIDEGYDMVIGWRINRQDKWLSRKLPSMIANRLIGKVTGLPVKDNGCSLKVYRANIIKRVPLYSDMHRFIPAMTLPVGARIAEVGVRHHARQFGESKYGLSRIFKVLLDLIAIKTLLLFARRPMRRFTGLAAAAAIMALLSAWPILFGTGATGSGSVMVYTSVAMLCGSLTLFLFLIGVVCALIHRQIGPAELYWLGGIPRALPEKD